LKTVAYLSHESVDGDLVWRAAQSATQRIGTVLTRLDDFVSTEVSKNVLANFIAEADVVISHISSANPNLLFEIGVAVGMRKRLVLVTNESSFLPFDLRGETLVSYERGDTGEERLSFKLENLIREQLRRRSTRFGTSYPRYKWDASGEFPSFDFRSIHGAFATATARRFEEWVGEIFSRISAWELITQKGADSGYDVVFWNEIPDSDLAALGNPIVVEAKAGKILTKSMVDQITGRAERQGLKGLILTTTAPASEALRKHILGISLSTGLSIVLLDRNDLATISSAKGLVASIKRRLSEIRRTPVG
jgi:hypothetical protein